MTRYLLHVGLPKTGTKYLQTNFRRLSSVLEERGVIYPADWWKDEHEVNHDRLAADLRAGNIEALRPVFDRLNASGRTVLLSCEGLSGFSAATLNNLQALMRRNVADIILYLSAMERLDTVSVAAGGKGGQQRNASGIYS